MNVELRPIESTTPYEKNPRKNEGAVDAVAKSLPEFGFRQPMWSMSRASSSRATRGSRRRRSSGSRRCRCMLRWGLTPEQARAYRLADNQTATIAEWDMDLLQLELGELKELDIDLDLLGFSDEEMTAINAPRGNDGLADPDDVPAPPDEPITKSGDLWILGNHRLLCGNSGSVSDLDRLLGGAKINLCNTDPPYNVKVEPRSNNAIAAGLSSFSGAFSGHQQTADLDRHPEKSKGTTKKMRAKDRPLANDFVTDEAFDIMLDEWFGNISRVLVPGGCFYIRGGYANCGNYPPVLKKHQLYFSQAIIWDKQHPVLTRKDFMGAHEWCFYGWREGAGHHFYGPNNVRDLWSIKKVNPQSMVHLTEKPVELAKCHRVLVQAGRERAGPCERSRQAVCWAFREVTQMRSEA